MKEHYAEVKCDYNNDEGYWTIDAWRTPDDNEEGKVVAVINDKTGDVYYCEPEARSSQMVAKVVRKKVREIRREISTKYNPFRIPDLTPMYVALRDFIKEHQGEKGFINTSDLEADCIYTIEYSKYSGEALELHVKAVRVNEHDCIEILSDETDASYDDDAILAAEQNDNRWKDLQYDDNLYYVPTVFNIAENIAEFV